MFDLIIGGATVLLFLMIFADAYQKSVAIQKLDDQIRTLQNEIYGLMNEIDRMKAQISATNDSTAYAD